MDNRELIDKLVKEIKLKASSSISIMEVCGTHTQAISRYGIKDLLPSNIKLISGPGCPVCVTHEGYIDTCIDLLETHDVILATFGDMAKVKGTSKSILDTKAEGGRVVIVYSPLEAIQLALKNKERTVAFLGVGFETTSPGIGLTVKTAEEKRLENIYFLLSLKLMEPVLREILHDNKHGLDGIICPGHVATVMGANNFRFIAEDYGISCAICGFEPLDIIGGIYFIIKELQRKENKSLRNLYKRCVTREGNKTAKKIMGQVFKTSDGYWRGIGTIKNSALTLKNKYLKYDALKRFNIKINYSEKNTKCQCGDIILGNKMPNECSLFGIQCTPEDPKGPCMVSSEGACSIFYRYNRRI